jgi:hypothetical protein
MMCFFVKNIDFCQKKNENFLTSQGFILILHRSLKSVCLCPKYFRHQKKLINFNTEFLLCKKYRLFELKLKIRWSPASDIIPMEIVHASRVDLSSLVLMKLKLRLEAVLITVADTQNNRKIYLALKDLQSMLTKLECL